MFTTVHPWNTKTTDPMLAFISGFAGYSAQAKQREEEKAKRERDREGLKVHLEIARKQHLAFWDLPDKPKEDKPPEPPAEDFLLTDDQMRSEIDALAFKPIADENLKGVRERQAKTAEAKAQLEKDIEADDF